LQAIPRSPAGDSPIPEHPAVAEHLPAGKPLSEAAEHPVVPAFEAENRLPAAGRRHRRGEVLRHLSGVENAAPGYVEPGFRHPSAKIEGIGGGEVEGVVHKKDF
jgi:hypothetical protein